jgi:hypothetical protein
VSEYLERTNVIDEHIKTIQNDTTLPIARKNEEIGKLENEKKLLDDLAIVTMDKICGRSNDLEDILAFGGQYPISRQFVVDRSPAVGLIRWNEDFGNAFNGPNDNEGNVRGAPWGTGFLISDDMFLTAGHCFDIDPNSFKTPRKNGSSIPGDSMVHYMNVIFNYEIGAGNKIRNDTNEFSIAKLVEYKCGGLDYAILQLNPNQKGLPGRQLTKLTLSPKTLQLSNHDPLCIIEHANGKEKKVCCGDLLNFDATTVYYGDVDTEFGSSGAPVIHFASGTVIGIHTDGDCETSRGRNYGTSIEAIRTKSKIIK